MSTDLTPTTDTRITSLADRNLGVTPLDVRQVKFTVTMRGFDRQEVTTFLAEAAEGYDLALRENERLRQDVVRLEGSLSQFKDLEGSLRNTLLSAQKLADDLKENAVQEAARMIKDAEARAELVVQQAHMRLEDTHREIEGLRVKRREAETAIESTVAALNRTLAFVREQEQRDREEQAPPQRPLLPAPQPLIEARTA